VKGLGAKRQRMAGKAGGLKGVALIGGAGGNSAVAGALHFFQDPSTGYTEVRGRVTGLAPGLHGFHIHSFGDTTNGCNSTGPHFNPHNKSHGAPSDDERHVGDLGNIVANKDGVADIFIKDLQISLSGPHSILGRAVVVHADSDDLGRGKHYVITLARLLLVIQN
jgi:Cu-Zn family superoxide dismutase